MDSAIFLEFLPRSHQYLLTILSIFWAFAQLLASGIAWPLLGNLTCQQTATECTRSENMGWRYFAITMGGISLIGYVYTFECQLKSRFVVRFFVFTLYESPKYWMGKGKDEEAVRIVHEVARRNGTTSTLTLGQLQACESLALPGTTTETTATAAIKRRLAQVDTKHISSLFATRRLAFSTGAIMVVWAFIGLAFPLYVSGSSIASLTRRMRSSPTPLRLEEPSSTMARPTLRTETPVSLLYLVYQERSSGESLSRSNCSAERVPCASPPSSLVSSSMEARPPRPVIRFSPGTASTASSVMSCESLDQEQKCLFVQVRCPLRLYSRGVPDQGSRNWQCFDCDGKSSLRNHG